MSGSSDGARSRALADVDGLAARMIALAEPVRFVLAETPAELDAMLRLRYETMVEQGWVEPDAFPLGLARDEDDDRARHVIGLDGDRLVAAGRLVYPEQGRLLPAERDFGVEIEPSGRVVELGRVLVAPAYRGRQHRVFLGLLARGWLEVRARGFQFFGGAATTWMLELYQSIGLQVSTLGPSQLHVGEHRYPVRVDMAASAPTLLQRLAGPASPR